MKCRPPGNRTPKAPEVARCSGWLRRQLELLDPPVVVALGLSAAKWFLGPADGAGPGARAGRTSLDGRAVWATYHPSAAIRFGPNGAPRAALAADLADLTAVAGDAGVRREHVLPTPEDTHALGRALADVLRGRATSSSWSGRWARARPR